MTWRVVVRALARRDIDRGCQYYDQESRELGDRFAATIDKVLGRIAENPLQYPVLFRDMRRVILHPFSYALFYKATAGLVRVFAVTHTSRDPRIWKRRG
jgi:plasmid stabilization system protein ParE